MIATGVPPSVTHNVAIHSLSERVGQMEGAVSEHFAEIKELMVERLGKVEDALVAGGAAASLTTLSDLVREQFAQWLSALPNTLQVAQQDHAAQQQPGGSSSSSATVSAVAAVDADTPLSVQEMTALEAAETRSLQQTFPMVSWGGKLHRVSAPVLFPRGIATLQLMQHWYTTNESTAVPPFRLLSFEDFRFEDQKGAASTDKAAKSYLSKAKTVATSVLEEGCRLGLLRKSTGMYRNLQHREQVQFVKGALESLFSAARTKKNSEKVAHTNVMTLSFLTVADEIQCLRTKG